MLSQVRQRSSPANNHRSLLRQMREFRNEAPRAQALHAMMQEPVAIPVFSFLTRTASQRRGRALESGKQDQTGRRGGGGEPRGKRRCGGAMAVASRHRRTQKLPDIESARASERRAANSRARGARGDERVTCSNVNTAVCIPIAAMPLASACQRRGWSRQRQRTRGLEETASPPHKDRARSPERDRPRRTT